MVDEFAPNQDGRAHTLHSSNVPSFLSKLKKANTFEPLPLMLAEDSTELTFKFKAGNNEETNSSQLRFPFSQQPSPKAKIIAREHSLGLPTTVKEVKDMLLDIVKQEQCH